MLVNAAATTDGHGYTRILFHPSLRQRDNPTGATKIRPVMYFLVAPLCGAILALQALCAVIPICDTVTVSLKIA